MSGEESGIHPLFVHPNGDKCIWLDGTGWFVPLDAGGEGYPCPHKHPADTARETAIKADDGGYGDDADRPDTTREAAIKALREAADAWTQGEWSDVMLPKPTPPAVPVIAYSNRVGDWLRDRADRIDGGAS